MVLLLQFYFFEVYKILVVFVNSVSSFSEQCVSKRHIEILTNLLDDWTVLVFLSSFSSVYQVNSASRSVTGEISTN